jgi:hypothetical protein
MIKYLANSVVLLIFFAVLFFIQHLYTHWADPRNNNIEQVVNRYDEIELLCYKKKHTLEEARQCDLFLNTMYDCDKFSGTDKQCDFDDFYNFVKRIGYQMPSMYKEGYLPKESWWDKIFN